MIDSQSNVIPSKLAHIPTEKIRRNPHNPRVLFDPVPLKILLESIKELGILVPLLIYESKGTGDYVILDGERRWLCAKELGLKDVPANVIEEPSRLNNILRMFNIHNVREPWELMPTALKLEVIIRELNTDSEVKLAKITSLPRSTVRRCKILLSFDKHYQDMMLGSDPERRMKPDLFIEMYPVLGLIRRKLPEVAREYPGNSLVDAFLDKYLARKLTSVTDFRRITASIRNIDKGLTREFVISTLLDFLREKKADLSGFIAEVDIFQGAKSVERSCQLLINRLSSFHEFPTTISADMKSILLELKSVIEEKLASMKS
ncbi:MAG: ParB/RepB/Spo0J family partition protein [Dehalococcoidales bacterium]|nr:ParB/RepB/Spo0J family partition protein [Dehalococcoidales bacterium]